MSDPSSIDYRNRFNRQSWLNERRKDLSHYLESRNLQLGEISEQPVFSRIPFTSVWAIKSKTSPGLQKYFGISGDHPTDVVSMGKVVDNPIQALEYFANKWKQAGERLLAGEPVVDYQLGPNDDLSTIGQLIIVRSEKLNDLIEQLLQTQ